MKLLFLLLIATISAAMEPQLAAPRAQTEIETLLSKVISPARFTVQVNAVIGTLTERRLIEGEQVTEPQAAVQAKPPALPGFVPPSGVEKPVPESSRRRQVFKTIEREVLKSLTAQVILDQSLPNETIVDSKRMVRRYLESAYGDKASANFVLVKMLAEPPLSTQILQLWPWLVLGLFVLGLLAMLFLVAKKILSAKPRLPASEPPVPQKSAETTTTALEEPWRDNALQFISANALAFRSFFQRLAVREQAEFCDALQGPSLDAFLEAIGLRRPASVGGENPELVKAKLSEFKTYLLVNKWRQEQLFGFLMDLPEPALLGLVRGEKPLIAATALKHMQPSQSAAVLSALSSEERQRLLAQSAEVNYLSLSDLSSIDRTLRARMNQTLMATVGGDEIEYWSNILSQTDDETLLEDVRAARPELAAHFRRFSFKLDQIAELPRQSVLGVLDDTDNDTLAMALLTCSHEVSHYMLNCLSERRRALLSEQMTALTQSSSDALNAARRNLTHRFREGLT